MVEHVAEIVYLVTQIQGTKHAQEALVEVDGGSKDALQVGAVHCAAVSVWLVVLVTSPSGMLLCWFSPDFRIFFLDLRIFFR